MHRQIVVLTVLVATIAAATACGGGSTHARRPTDGIDWPAMDPRDKHHPDVLQARLVPVGAHRYDLTVTISSPYDSRFRYASGWRLSTARGDWLGERDFGGDHALEQPWTRVLRAVRIPATVREVVVEGKDIIYGYGGRPAFLRVP